MKMQFKDLNRSIGKYRCVSLGNEDCLVGERGEIWVKGEGTYGAFVVTVGKQEKLFTFKSKDLAKWVFRLKVPVEIERQLFLVNNPNTRLV